MKVFHVIMDAYFEAEDIDDIVLKLAQRFQHEYEHPDEEPPPPMLKGEIEIEEVVNGDI